MRGLWRAAVLLALALARANPLPSPEDEISSAYIKLGLESADGLELTFRLGINESKDTCGYANVTINGETLPEGGRGTLVLDWGVAVVASWSFTCVSWNDRPQEQLMSLDIEYADGHFVDHLGFTVRFQQVRPVWISDIEGTASMMRMHKAKAPAQQDASAAPAPGAEEGADAEEGLAADLQLEMAELDYLQFQLMELGGLVRAKELRLRDKLDSMHAEHADPHPHDRRSPPMDLSACDNLKCVVTSLYRRIADAAAAFYGDVAEYGSFFEGRGPPGRYGGGRGRGWGWFSRDGRGHHLPHCPPHHGKGNHTWPPPWAPHWPPHHGHHGNHSHHGNHTWPPPWWRRPPVHPPPFCKCPPGHEPPHHEPPHHEPPHHEPPRPPSPPPHGHGPPPHDDLSPHDRPPLDGPPAPPPPPPPPIEPGPDRHAPPPPFPPPPFGPNGHVPPPFPGEDHGPLRLFGVHMAPPFKIAFSAVLLLTFVAVLVRRCFTKSRGGEPGSRHHRRRFGTAPDGPRSRRHAFVGRLLYGQYHNHPHHHSGHSYGYDYEKADSMGAVEKPDHGNAGDHDDGDACELNGHHHRHCSEPTATMSEEVGSSAPTISSPSTRTAAT